MTREINEKQKTASLLKIQLKEAQQKVEKIPIVKKSLNTLKHGLVNFVKLEH